MDLELSDEQRLIVVDRARFRPARDRSARAELDPDSDELPRDQYEHSSRRSKAMGLYCADVPEAPRRPGHRHGHLLADVHRDVTASRRPLRAVLRRVRRIRPRSAARGKRRSEAALPVSRAQRREAKLLRPDRAFGRQRPGRARSRPPPVATATTGSSTAPSTSSAAPTARTSASPSRGPTRTRDATASPASSSTPTRPGFHVRRVIHTLRSARYATEIQFEELRVPDGNVLGEVNKGFAIARDRVARQRIPYSAGCIGVATLAQEMAIDYAKPRSTFGAPLATRQAIQWMLVDNEIDLRQARWITLDAAWKADRGERFHAAAAMAKVVATEAAAASSIARCRFTAGWASPRSCRSSGGTASCGSGGSARARTRSSA